MEKEKAKVLYQSDICLCIYIYRWCTEKHEQLIYQQFYLIRYLGALYLDHASLQLSHNYLRRLVRRISFNLVKLFTFIITYEHV